MLIQKSIWAAGFMFLALTLVVFIFQRHHKISSATYGLQNGNPLLTADSAESKKQAVQLFASYTSGRTKPVWESWKDQCEVKLLNGCKDEPAEERNSASFHLIHSMQIPPQLSSNENLMPVKNKGVPAALQTIYYNDDAAGTILRKQIYDSIVFNKLLQDLLDQHAPIVDLDIPDFPSGSVVVKTAWELIYPSTPLGGYSPTNYTPLNVYNSSALSPDTEEAPNPEQKLKLPIGWPKIYIDINQKQDCTQRKKGAADIYTLGCFIFRSVSSNDYDQLSEHISRSPSFINKATCTEKECYLILVGVHIMTRKIKNWMWMTYWWTNEGSHSSASDKWAFFEANATNNPTAPVANPYLEGPSSGMKSNCMNCHRFAAYNPSFQATSVGLILAKTNLTSASLQSPSCYFEKSLRTHFLWTIAVFQNSSINKNTNPCP